MTNKMTRRALLTSIMALFLCFTMLLGTTYAWFNDTVSSEDNIIKSGMLDVEMYWAKGTEDPTAATWNDASTGAIFDCDQWEPGYVEVRHIKIENKGSLALKYSVSIEANGEVSDLADVIDVYYVDPAIQVADRTSLANAPRLGTLAEVLANLGTSGNGTLEAGKADTITIALKMQETAGDDYQDKSIGTDFSIQLIAIQLESDGFDDQDGKDDGLEYGKTDVGSYNLDVLSNGMAAYDDDAKTYTVVVDTVAQGGWNASQGAYYAGYTVNVAGYGENATVKFVNRNGTEVSWLLADEERDGFIKNGEHQQWTAVGISSAYRYDIDGDGVTDFTVVNDVSSAKVEVADEEQFKKVVADEGVNAILKTDIALTSSVTVAADANVVLNLNGYTLSLVSTQAAASCAIENKGSLTITNGTITYEGVGSSNNSYGTNTINNVGKLVVDGATIINTTATGSSNAIDCAPGAELVVNSGEIVSEKIAVRVRDGASATINDGSITGSRGLQIHLIHNNNQATSLTINGGSFTTTNAADPLAIYSYAYGNCTFANTTITITGGTFNGDVAFGGGNKTATETVSITGGTFNGELGRWTPDADGDGETDWLEIAKP